MHTNSEGLGDVFKGEFGDMCANNLQIVLTEAKPSVACVQTRDKLFLLKCESKVNFRCALGRSFTDNHVAH